MSRGGLPTIDEAALDEPDGTEDYAPKADSATEQAKSLLLWMRKHRFSCAVLQLEGLTLHGLQDHVPRKQPPASGGDERRLDPILADFAPDLAEAMRTTEPT